MCYKMVCALDRSYIVLMALRVAVMHIGAQDMAVTEQHAPTPAIF